MRRHPLLLFCFVVAAAVLMALDKPKFQVVVAVTISYFMILAGIAVLGGLATPIPEPPPPGELRKVKIMFRCSLCGAEVRMTIAPNEDPQPPRHCLEDMDLVAPVDGI